MKQVSNKRIVYKQVYDVLSLLDTSEIPENIIINLEENMDSVYKFDMKKEELLEEAKDILSVIYTDYLSSDEEKDVIKKLEKVYAEQLEIDKRKKYNIDVFKKDINIETESTSNKLIEKKESIFERIIKFLKGIFK